MRTRVFLGGTCNNSTWRQELIPWLTIDYFDPVVPDWTPECQAEEIKQRVICDFVLYCITKEMTGVYSVAEVVDDSNKRPDRTIFLLLEDGFDEGQLRSLRAVAKMVEANGSKVFYRLSDAARYMNDETERQEENERQRLLRE